MKKTLLVLALCILPLIAAASMVQRNDAALRYGMGGQVFASPSAQVWVYSTGTTSIVPIYSDSTGSTPLTQPVIADKFGQYSYYVAPGVYDESIIGTSGTISKTGIVVWSDLYSNTSGTALYSNTSGTALYSNDFRAFSSTTSGIVPQSDATYSTTEYLRGDGTWTTPSASPASYESTTAYLMDSSKTISTAEIPLNKLSLVTVCGSFSALQSYCTGTINSTANAVIGIDTLGTAAWDNINQIQVPIFSNGTAFVAYGCITDRVYSSSYPDTYDGTLNAVFSGATCSNMVKKLNVISR